MDNRFFRLIYLLLFVSTPFLSQGQNNPASLTELLEGYISENRIPGAMISIVSADSNIFVGGVGYANIEKGEKVTELHLFRQGSISKSFTAMGLYKLLDYSPYTLNTPIKSIDPDIPFTNQWAETNPVTVAHLLEHTSGFEDFHLHAMYNVKDSQMPPMVNSVGDHRNSLHSRWLPGTRKAYANPNYIVAGHLIERVAEEPFADYINANLLAPMGMESSGFYFKKPQNLPFAQEYQRNGNSLNPIPFSSINGSPAGDFSSNAKDMAAFLRFMLNRDSSLFSHQEYERIEKPETSIAAQKGLTAGYGLGNYSIWKNGYLFHGHGGEIDGFAARYIYSREANLGIAIAINRNGDANALVDFILDKLIGERNQAPNDRVTSPIPDSIKAVYAGFYEFKSPKNNLLAFSDRMFAGLTLDFQTDKVITRTILGKAKDTLYYASDHQFYYNQEGEPSVMLMSPPNAKPALWINDNYTEKESHTLRLIIFSGLLLSILFMTAFILHSLIWLMRNWLKKRKKPTINHLILSGAGLSMILMLVGFGMSVSQPKTAMYVSFPALLMMVSSYVLVLLSFASIYRWRKLASHRRFFKTFYILTSIGAVMISIYLWDIGYIGLKLWSY